MGGPEPRVRIGRIVGPHGVCGAVRIDLLTDFPERFHKGATLRIGEREAVVQSVSFHQGQARVQFQGFTTVEEAEALKWEYVTVAADERPELEDGEYLARDLIGLPVFTEDGRELGTLDEVLPYPAHDLWRVGAILVPAVRQFVLDVSLEDRRITVRLIPGMEPE
ncbi:MAG: 16S rRNA processing protein RimM [Fimbriimonadaceae bacterium]|nr:16S rRNA processing protein RimM [Fimbriimonadaceae bacterium]QYK59386.1 MAG: 16S rRNA processing protein RimM [Fimbriimonadaceae bacterium]